MKKKNTLNTVLGVILGNFIVALGVVGFVIPNGLVMGGATGIGLALSHYTGIEISVVVLIINMLLFGLGFWQMGKKFAMSIILSTITYPILLKICQSIPALETLTENPVLATIYAGLAIGLGVGIIIRVGAASGGTDILAIVFNKYTHFPVATCLYAIDFLIILAQLFFSTSEQLLYGVLALMIMTFVISKVTVLGQAQIQLFVVSKEYQKIRETLLKELSVGATMVKIATGLENKEQEGVLCVIHPRRLYETNQVIQSIDEQAFITISQINEVKGRGFSLDRYYKNEQ